MTQSLSFFFFFKERLSKNTLFHTKFIVFIHTYIKSEDKREKVSGVVSVSSRRDGEVEILVNGKPSQKPRRTDGHTEGVELLV